MSVFPDTDTWVFIYAVVTSRVKCACVPVFSQFWHIGGRSLEILLMMDCLTAAASWHSCDSKAIGIWFQILWNCCSHRQLWLCQKFTPMRSGVIMVLLFLSAELDHYHSLPCWRKGKPECVTRGFKNFPQIIPMLGICLEQDASNARLWVQGLFMPLS